MSSENILDRDSSEEWTPPTDAELKVLEARRERSDKISKIMGQYLLKGYKMLSISCPNCDCVLLQDRHREDYCVACSEVDADTKKDNPAVSIQAAQRTVEESVHRQNISNGYWSGSVYPNNQIINVQNNTACQTSNDRSNHSTTTTNEITQSLTKQLDEATDVLTKKLTWASYQLSQTNGIQDSIQIAKLISETVIAISNVKNLEKTLIGSLRTN